MMSADNIDGLRTDGVGKKYVGLYKKEKIRVQVILEMFSFVKNCNELYLSRIHV